MKGMGAAFAIALLVFFNCSCLYAVAVIYGGHGGLLAPGREVRILMYVRATLFAVLAVGSVLYAVRAFRAGISLRRLIVWSIPVALAVALLVYLGLGVKNELVYPRCCGLGSFSEWGYPFSWVKCYSTDLCDPADRRVDRLALMANVLFGLNAAVSLTGIGVSLQRFTKRLPD